MKLIRVGAAALNQTPLDWDGNVRNITEAIASARQAGVGLLCLPELCVTGYGCEDAFLSPGVQATALDVLTDEILPATQGLAVALGLPLQFRKALFNVVAFLVDGQIAGFVAKRFLAGDGIHYEPRWFKAWPEGRRVEVEVAGELYPLGDFHFICDGVAIGFEICEDAWVARRPGSRLAEKGVDVLLNPSASHFAFDKHEIRRRFVVEGSRAFGVSYVYANLLGNEAGRVIFDGGALIASAGHSLAEGRRFSFSDIELTSAVVDIDETRMLQARSASYMPDLDPQPAEQVRVDFTIPGAGVARHRPETASWERGGRLKEEEFTRAIVLGLFDYLRKSHSRGFVVSLSGGADSAATSVLVALMIRMSLAELGPEGFRDKLSYLGITPGSSAEEIVKRLLLCVYQATRNSSETTRAAAAAVAESLGAEYFELDVDDLVETYKALVGKALERQLSWEHDDLALQNIQARARGPSVWMLANIRGALLLATSNRSEAAVGYATMDGDTCGGLSPIAGIDKAFLRQWLQWMESDGPEGQTACPALRSVNQQQPTAELRPPSAGQTDEDDLMPYPLLDAIERAAIRDKKLPEEVYEILCVEFPKHTPAKLGGWVERFFRLWCRNQWKRERYAPSFHVDDENLDPKSWCRFPILSGGFERELARLQVRVEKDGE
jgi:NAD+ synthase (glutamine-hydrolysing)